MPEAEEFFNYRNRTFQQKKDQQISYVDLYYPEILQDFTDSSFGTLLLELNAGTGNIIEQNLDRAFQETQIDYAQNRTNIVSFGKNLGVKNPGKKAAITVVEFTINVPAKGDNPDSDYFPTILPGAQINGGGQIFETIDVVDFSSPISSLGFANRSYIPISDANGIIQSYQVVKRELVYNGRTQIYKRVITDTEIKPFYQLILPDPNVVSIESVIQIPGTNFSTDPQESDFNNPDYKFYEVEALAQQSVIDDDITNTSISESENDDNNIKSLRLLKTTRRFTKEFTSQGACVLTFGGGQPGFDPISSGLLKNDIPVAEFIKVYTDNTSLGERLRKDNTLFIKYRTGGGVNSNVGANVLNSVGNITINITGPNSQINQTVRRSLQVSNPIPAVGGLDALSNEELRNLIKFNFLSQNRATTVTDYNTLLKKLPGRYGIPYKSNSFVKNNKVVIPILGIDSAGKLTNTSSSVLKENITRFLADNRTVNDYVEVVDGKILNLAIDITVFVTDNNSTNIVNDIIQTVATYFNVSSNFMGQDLFVSTLERQIQNVNGVINLLGCGDGIKIYNKVSGLNADTTYSSNVTTQGFIDTTTGQINLINNTVYSAPDTMFEIKYPNKDIRVFLKKRNNF